MTAKAHWLDLTPEQRNEIAPYYGTRGWRRISPSELPSFVPDLLRAKIVSALAITAETSTGGTYLVFSARRFDPRDMAFDNQPAGAMLHMTGASTEAVFIDHGDWPLRTELVPSALMDLLMRDGVAEYLFAVAPAGKQEGTLAELEMPHREAFDVTVAAIRGRVDRVR